MARPFKSSWRKVSTPDGPCNTVMVTLPRQLQAAQGFSTIQFSLPIGPLPHTAGTNTAIVRKHQTLLLEIFTTSGIMNQDPMHEFGLYARRSGGLNVGLSRKS